MQGVEFSMVRVMVAMIVTVSVGLEFRIVHTMMAMIVTVSVGLEFRIVRVMVAMIVTVSVGLELGILFAAVGLLDKLVQGGVGHQVVHVHDAVQMIDLVLQRLGQELFRVHLEWLGIQAQGAGPHPLGAHHHAAVAGNAETALLQLPQALGPDDLGVDQDHGLFHVRSLDHADALQHAHLVGRQPHAVVLRHCLYHVIGQFPVLRRNLGDLPRLPKQDGVRHQPDGQYRHERPLNCG